MFSKYLLHFAQCTCPIFIFSMVKVVKEEVEVEKVEEVEGVEKKERLREVGSLGKFPNQSHQVMTFLHGIVQASF